MKSESSKFLVLITLNAFSVVGMPLLGVNAPVKAQLVSDIKIAQNAILYVDPNNGLDAASRGKTESNPLRSITFALAQASSGTVIQLAPGQYNRNEVFPIKLKSGVTLKGEADQQGKSVVITGGGEYISSKYAGQNITILGANNSQISGITVTNRNKRGTGIWIESTNPIISDSTFINNNREGIFITGKANPRIENNQFINNKGNGISITAESGGEIKGNILANTGVGINISEKANPQITDNQIRNNRDGLVITEESRPMVQGNVIENNSEYGIIITGEAQANLSNNMIRGNRINQQNSRSGSNNLENSSEDIVPSSNSSNPSRSNKPRRRFN